MGREFSWVLISYQGFLLGPLLPRFPPSSLPFPFPSPALSGLDFSTGGDPTQWVRKCLCGCVECGTCPMNRDLEMTAIAMRWISILPGLSAPAECSAPWMDSSGSLPHSRSEDELCMGVESHMEQANWGVLPGSPGDASAAVCWTGSCWQLCEAAGGSLRPDFLTRCSFTLPDAGAGGRDAL